MGKEGKMSGKTNFLNLKKPDSLDYYDIQDFNDNSDIIDKKAQELANNADEDRKRVDNLLLSNTIDAQEIGKTVLTTFISGTPVIMNYLTSDIIYDKMFNGVSSKDTDFVSILDSGQGYAVKLLKPGLYNMKFVVKVKREAGLPEIPMKIMLKSGNSLDGNFETIKTEYLVFPATSSAMLFKSVEFMFAINEPAYIKLFVTNEVDLVEGNTGTESFSFTASECEITILDWIGKKSGAAGETADIRLGADGNQYKTAGESVRKQFQNADKKSENIKEFSRDQRSDLAEYVLGTPNIAIANRLASHDGFTVYQSASEHNKIFIVNDNAKAEQTWELLSQSVYEKSQYYTDATRLITGSTYQIFGVTSDVTIDFLSEDNGIIETVYCNYTSKKFTIPAGSKKMKLYVNLNSGEVEVFLNIFICKYSKTLLEQIDELNTKMDAMQQIITKLVAAPTLTADTNGNLQITENEEG